MKYRFGGIPEVYIAITALFEKGNAKLLPSKYMSGPKTSTSSTSKILVLKNGCRVHQIECKLVSVIDYPYDFGQVTSFFRAYISSENNYFKSCVLQITPTGKAGDSSPVFLWGSTPPLF
jgi:hypothetical protein